MEIVDSLPSFSEIVAALRATPGGDRAIERCQAQTYNDFVNILKRDIDEIINDMERNRQRFQKSSEDEITFYISSMLNQLGYTATNGSQFGGSVDLTVQKVLKGWLWTAEAKIFTALDKVNEGFLQLTSRYSPSSLEDAKAGMLIYVLTKNAADKMKTWKSHLENSGDSSLTTEPCASRPNLAFYSTQTHDGSGLPLSIRHIGVALYFKPIDVSGRAAKKYNSAPS
ncbi:hypothetical protein [Hydrogenophaga sp.]|uniref:hypothetical protein n=1 Tax=Hydrogenophaga sp. TaxID=1904254 RepID=UPI003F70468E